MSVNYDKIFEIELLNEYISGIVSRQVNRVLSNKSKDTFDILLLNQLEEMEKIDKFKLTLSELEELKKYWQSMNELTKALDTKKEVA